MDKRMQYVLTYCTQTNNSAQQYNAVVLCWTELRLLLFLFLIGFNESSLSRSAILL